MGLRIAKGQPNAKKFISVSAGKRFKEVRMICKNTMAGIATKWKAVDHYASYFGQVMYHAKCIGLIENMLSRAVVCHDIKGCPSIVRRTVEIQIKNDGVMTPIGIDTRIIDAESLHQVAR